jgi:hypothetical protein
VSPLSAAGSACLDESLEVFGRRGGPAAREAAARLLGGDRSPEALAAWKAHAMPLYGSESDGDMAARGAVPCSVAQKVEDFLALGKVIDEPMVRRPLLGRGGDPRGP